MKHGDFILIDFIGRVKNTGEIFDLTDADEAKKAKIYNEKQKYGPAPVIIGAGDVVPGVEKELEKMKVGEEKGFDVPQGEGFGKRDLSLIKILSAAKFFKKNINPIPGLFVDIDGMACKIMAVSGGRVRVDFNHPLAGKDLSYSVKIVKEISSQKEKLELVLERFGLKGTVSLKEGTSELQSNSVSCKHTCLQVCENNKLACFHKSGNSKGISRKAEISVEKKLGPAVERLLAEFIKKWVGVEVGFVSK